MFSKIAAILFLIPFMIFAQNKAERADVIALSDLFADYFIFVSDEELDKLKLEKGSWNPVSEAKWSDYLTYFNQKPTEKIGGSGMNVIKGLSYLGKRCIAIGKRGDDKAGQEIEDKLVELGIHPSFTIVPSSSSKVLCLITSDGERTMISSIQNYSSYPKYHLDPHLFKGAKLLHIEGYQIANVEFMEEACQIAKEHGLLISLDLGSRALVHTSKPIFEYFLEKYIDILFANSQELRAFSGTTIQDGMKKIQGHCDLSIVTNGKEGGWIVEKNKIYSFDAFPSTPIDTTGAGDLFSAGFLYAYIQGYAPKTSATVGAKLASHVIRYIGTDLPPAVWKKSSIEIEDILMQSLVCE